MIRYQGQTAEPSARRQTLGSLFTKISAQVAVGPQGAQVVNLAPLCTSGSVFLTEELPQSPAHARLALSLEAEQFAAPSSSLLRPVLNQSKRCHINDITPSQLVPTSRSWKSARRARLWVYASGPCNGSGRPASPLMPMLSERPKELSHATGVTPSRAMCACPARRPRSAPHIGRPRITVCSIADQRQGQGKGRIGPCQGLGLC